MIRPDKQAKNIIMNANNPEKYTDLEWMYTIGGSIATVVLFVILFVISNKMIWLIFNAVMALIMGIGLFTNVNQYIYYKRKRSVNENGR